MCVSWEVVTVADQGKLNVFSFHEKEAKEMSEKIMACIAEETVSSNDSELPWFKDFYEKEQSRIIIESAKNGKIIVFMTTDLRKTYFDVKRPPKSPQNKTAGGSPLQNRASGEKKDPTTIVDLPDNTMRGNATNRTRSAKKHEPDVPVQKGQKGNDGKEDRLIKVGLEFKRQKIECLHKSGFFAKNIPKNVQVEFFDEVIQLEGPNLVAVKLTKDKIKQRMQDIKSKSINVTNKQTKILTMNHALDFIDHSLNIPKMCVSWEVVTVADQGKLNVFSFHEKEAKEMSEKIMACIAEETVSPNDSELPWFKDFYEKEKSRIIIESAKNGKIIVFMTTDLRKTYFDVKRHPKSPQNKAAGGSPLQNRASGEKKDPTSNQQTGATFRFKNEMVQQGGGRRNKTVASPDEVGPGPGFSPQSSSDLTMREKMTFKTKEVIPTEKDTERKSAQVVKTSGILLPSHWFDMGNENFMKIAIKPGDESFKNYEWENIQTTFESTLPQARIVSIQRIQNIFMWEHFYLKKRQLEQAYGKDCSNQLPLFHGTTPDMLDVIAEQNLDPRKAGDRMGARLGQGTYFAVSPEYSDLYAQSDSQGHKFMFFANVLAGKSCIGKADFKRPPLNPDMKPRLFDSCVDNVQNPKVYCIFHDTQYYLKYLIEYT